MLLMMYLGARRSGALPIPSPAATSSSRQPCCPPPGAAPICSPSGARTAVTLTDRDLTDTGYAVVPRGNCAAELSFKGGWSGYAACAGRSALGNAPPAQPPPRAARRREQRRRAGDGGSRHQPHAALVQLREPMNWTSYFAALGLVFLAYLAGFSSRWR